MNCLSSGRSEKSVFGPARLYSEVECLAFYTAQIRSISDAHLDAVVFDKYIVAPVSALFIFCCPFAVTRFVMPIVVDSFNRVTRGRSVPHIVNEVLKIIPSFAYFNPAPAVSRITLVGRVGASGSHLHPCVKFDAHVTTRRMPVLCFSSDDSRKPQTPTTPFPTRSEFLAGGKRLFTTVAKTYPLNKLFAILGFFDNCELSETLTTNVNKFSHNSLYASCGALGSY